MTDDEKRRWDSRVALIAPCLTLLTIAVGIWQFNRSADNRLLEQTQAAITQDDMQFRRRIWTDATQSCTELTQLAARIAAQVDAGERPGDLPKDWIARYWGVSLTLDRARPLDRAVEGAIIEFRADIEDLRNGGFERQIGDRLKTDAHALGEACGARIRAGSSELLRRAGEASR